MRMPALLVAVFTVVVGIVGIVSPEYGTMVRRTYFATSITLYAVAALRMAMGVVVSVAAPASRAPRIMQVLGVVMCLQALTAIVLGPDHARSVLEWESMQGPAILRVGAALALAAGAFMVFAFTGSVFAFTGSRPNGVHI